MSSTKYKELAWIFKADKLQLGAVDERDVMHYILSVPMDLLKMLEGLPNRAIDAAAFDNDGEGDGVVIFLSSLDTAEDREYARRLVECMNREAEPEAPAVKGQVGQ